VFARFIHLLTKSNNSIQDQAPLLLPPKQGDTVLSLWRSWFKCPISSILCGRRMMNFAAISYFVWWKVREREEVFMPDLLASSVVLNGSEQPVSGPIFNAWAITALGNRFQKWSGICSLSAV